MNIREPRNQKLILAGIGVAALGYLYFFSTVVPFGPRPLARVQSQLEVQIFTVERADRAVVVRDREVLGVDVGKRVVGLAAPLRRLRVGVVGVRRVEGAQHFDHPVLPCGGAIETDTNRAVAADRPHPCLLQLALHLPGSARQADLR